MVDELLTVGVVLYNFKLEKIKKIVEEYEKHVYKFIFVDNNSKNYNEAEEYFKSNPNILIIKNDKNEGIAKALNQILEKAYEINAKYLLTLDQDSYIELDPLIKMEKFIDDDIAIICPEIYDLNKKYNKLLKNGNKEVTRCITSGSLMNLKVCKKIGYFDEKMFIDYVDFDYCKRIIMSNYKILKIKDCFLKHEVGKRTIKKFLWIYVYPTNHSPERNYYYMRNVRYYCLKHNKSMSTYEKLYEYIRIIWRYTSIILYEENKKEKIKAVNRGFKDAKEMLLK